MSLEIALERIREAKNSNASQLDLSDLDLTEIPDISELIHLTNLTLDSNNLTEIRGLNQLTNLCTLDINNNYLITEIKGLDNLRDLTSLSLFGNQITEIKGLDKLNNLTHLYLYQNELTEIKGLDNLTNLKCLYLNKNHLKEIKGLDNLIQLFDLHLDDNQITEIHGLDNLKNLKTLSLKGNKLINMEGLDRLLSLTEVDLEGNEITEIPESLLSLGLPIKLLYTRKSKKIFVGDNPFTIPPPEVIKQGNVAIQEYIVQRKTTGEELLLEAKLILLGDGRSGKTSLVNRLLGKELPKEIDRTPGVDIVIGEYSFPLTDGKEFKINIWDFAGQDKYKTLHQLFYTESSLYVMVAEAGNMTTDFDDWFQTAQVFGEGSPLLLLLNEFKEGIGFGSFDSNYWKRQFPELLKEVLTVNLGLKQNFAAAEEYIRLLAQTLPHTKYSFPTNWAAIRRVLHERRNEQYITLKDYLKICSENNLPERESALILSSVLHKVGDCLHYQKNDLLRQFIILKNEWATEAVYKILEDKVVAEEKCGFFDLADLERIWDSAEYIDMRPQLLELMKQFKLAYQLPGKEEFVTPPLLPPAKPADFSWPEIESLELYIDYDFLPKALLTQFIVTRHADIAKDRTLVWRHGVVLKWENEALAEVSKTKLEGRDAFYIRTQGSNRKGMMTVILKTFRELHGEYKGIKYREKVPCICKGCKTGENTQHYFDFSNLQFRLEKGRHEIECNNSLETLNVMQLLENSFVFEKLKEGHALHLKRNVAKDNPSTLRILKLFLASSNELVSEREEIERELGRKNKSLRKKGFLIDLLFWEDDKYISKSLRSQDNYNLEIEQCHLFVVLFYSKVGKYTLEEFELAKSLFEKARMPRIRIFQKKVSLPANQSREDSDSRHDFLDQLREMEHFSVLFENNDKLINELETTIDKLLEDEDFVEKLSFE